MHESPCTLARISQSPFRRSVGIGVSAKTMAQTLLGADKEDKRLPDSEATRFYALNQLVNVLGKKFTPHEKLPPWGADVVMAYEKCLQEQHRRMVWYMFLICTREFRYLKNAEVVLSKPPYSEGFKALHSKVTDNASQSAIDKWLVHVPDEPLRHFLHCLEHQFKTKSGYATNYGGPKWAEVVSPLRCYVAGETCAEVLVDTAYTLAHNTAPIFNKDMLYVTNSHNFIKLLDVQRSGQVCEGLVEGTLPQWFTLEKAGELLALVQNVRKNLEGVGEYIDWYKVESLGSKGKYNLEKVTQDKKYGKTPTTKLVNGKPIKVVGTMEVYPGTVVDVIERMAA